MKKGIIIFSLTLIGLSFLSCKKKIYGCMDETALNYSSVANENAQNCVFEKEDQVLISNTNKDVAWNNAGTYWEIVINWNEITQSVLDNGAVDAYIGDGTGWTPIPVVIFESASYSTSIQVYYELGQVALIWTDSDGTLPNTPPNSDVKLVIVK